MASNRLSELILKAKGDRSFRKYQKDCGVDAAVISKMANGTYIPKNPEVYRKLTSCDSNGVSFEDLVEAAGYSSEYLKGLEEGAKLLQTTLKLSGLSYNTQNIPVAGALALGSLTNISQDFKSLSPKSSVNKASKYQQKAQQHTAIANGIIFLKLAQNGIMFKQRKNDLENLDSIMGTQIEVLGCKYSELIIKNIFFHSSESVDDILVNSKLTIHLGELSLLNKDKSRKVSIVTNSLNAYEYICQKAKNISYQGNLSVILINTESVEFVKETILCTFDESINPDDLLIDVGGEKNE